VQKELANLKSLLAAAIDGSASKIQQSELVHHSRMIIEAYLTHHRPRITTLCLYHGLTITELAYDCIGEAFSRNAENLFLQLKNLADALRTPFHETPDHEIFLAFKGFLTSVANAQLARLYAQANSTQSRIYRNIKEATKNGRARFALTRDYRGYVLTPETAQPLDHLPPYPYAELEQHFLQVARSREDIPDLLDDLSRVLNSQNHYRRSVPIVEVVCLFKNVYKPDGPEQADLVIWPDETLSEEEIEHLCRQVGQAIHQKIVLTYLLHGKLDRHQAEGLAKAVYGYLLDMCLSGDKPTSLYYHVNSHLHITEEEYAITLRPKAEYMLTIAKEELAARLMREL
jgi:hypothetical protein